MDALDVLKKAGCNVLVAAKIASICAPYLAAAQEKLPTLAIKEDVKAEDANPDEKTAPKPAEVRDGIVDAISSGQQPAFSPQITMSDQEIPPMILEMLQPLLHRVSGNIQLVHVG
jgi:hypothetical protein